MLLLILVTVAVFYVFYFISMLNLLLYLKDIQFNIKNEAYQQRVNNRNRNSEYYFNEDYNEWNYKKLKSETHLYNKKKKAYLKNLGFKEMPKSNKELKEAYRKAAKKHHPDLGGTEENFAKINDSYEFIKNELEIEKKKQN